MKGWWLTIGKLGDPSEMFVREQLIRDLRVGDVIAQLARFLWHDGDDVRASERRVAKSAYRLPTAMR